MNAASVWLTLFLAGLLTFVTRLSFIALWGRWAPPGWLRRALRFVPPAVLTAIIFPELLIRDGTFIPFNPRLLAGVVAAWIAWRTKNIVWTIVVGMGVLLLLQLFWP
ncbi:MAG: AzlD domain-containing protein [Chloroflexota bacterium]